MGDCDASCGGSFHWSSDAGCQCDSIVQPPQTGYDSNCYIHSGCLTGKAGYSTDPNDSMGEGWYCTDGQYVDMNTKFDACGSTVGAIPVQRIGIVTSLYGNARSNFTFWSFCVLTYTWEASCLSKRTNQ